MEQFEFRRECIGNCGKSKRVITIGEEPKPCARMTYISSNESAVREYYHLLSSKCTRREEIGGETETVGSCHGKW
jgi:hypothetical protein